MRVAIVGAGAMGGLWAARIAATGTPVTIVDVSEALVSAVKSEGLAVQTGEGTEIAHPEATTDAAAAGLADVVFFFVKAQHTAAAATLARPLVGPNTIVVSQQNGWGNADVLAGVYAPAHIVIGVTYHSATVLGPGRVAHTGTGPTVVGPYEDRADLDRAKQVGALLGRAGIDTTVTATVKTEVWKKLILNAATLPTASLTLLRAGALGEPGPMLDLVDAVASEAVAVARAQGYDIDRQERIARIHTVLAGAGQGKGSMLQDVEARRKTEIEVINGAVVRAAARHDITVPLNSALVALIGGLERGWGQAS